MGREWSKYQKNIFDAYENTRKNLFIKATAGASKTTCMLECAKRTSPSKISVFLAFNKSISNELQSKVPRRTEATTFHSKGLKVLLRNFRMRFKINENKTFAICKQILDLSEIPSKQQARYLFELQEIWNQIRTNLLVDYPKDIPLICIERDIDFRDRMIEDIQAIEKEWKKRNRDIQKGEFVMDFTDMLWLPYIMVSEEDYPKYDVVFIDEGQDLNVLQREFALRLKSKYGRFIIVGDFSQAIYGFQGASIDNFAMFQREPNTIVLPLSITYRCARRIVEEAKLVFPNDIEAAPDAIEGVVRRGNLEEAESGDFVLCRNNIPLVEAFIFFLKKKKKAVIKGKDFGEDLLYVLDRASDVKSLDLLLEEKIKKLQERGIPRTAALNHPSYVSLEEKCMIIKILYGTYGSMVVLYSAIKEIFSDNIEEGIVLSTCHKSKGLEADRVFFLNPELIPHPKAITEKALYGEKCLKFVAITRAKKELVYCNI